MSGALVRPGVALYLVRHGETDWNRDGRFQGRTDTPLNAAGIAQAKVLGRRLAGQVGASRPDILSSPLQRARRSAEEICLGMGRQSCEVQIRDELAELSFGEWEGMTTQEIKADYPEHRRARRGDRWNVAAPGGESFGERAPDLREFLDGLDRSSILVCHAGVIRICLYLLGASGRETALTEPISHQQIYVWSDGTLAAR